MPFSLNGSPIQSATLNMERLAVWRGRASVAGTLDIAEGAAIVLTLGDTDFHGYVVAGGTFPGASESTYEIAGGAAGWSRPVIERGYQIPAGVPLTTAAAQLATDAGEQLDLSGVGGILGDHWTRPAGPASVALSALFPLTSGGWRVDPDGVARPGARPPAPAPASVRLVVQDQNRAARWALLGLPDDAVSAVLPGAIITAENLATPIVVATTTIHASSSSVTVEVTGEGGIVEMLVAIVQALTPSRVFGGTFTYQVADVDTGRPNLNAVDKIPGLPATLAADKVPGVPGVTSTLAAGAQVMLSFRDGNPARPYVVSYLPGVLPASVVHDAQVNVQIGGGTPTAIAMAVPLEEWAGTVQAAFAGLGVTITGVNCAAPKATTGL